MASASQLSTQHNTPSIFLAHNELWILCSIVLSVKQEEIKTLGFWRELLILQNTRVAAILSLVLWIVRIEGLCYLMYLCKNLWWKSDRTVSLMNLFWAFGSPRVWFLKTTSSSHLHKKEQSTEVHMQYRHPWMFRWWIYPWVYSLGFKLHLYPNGFILPVTRWLSCTFSSHGNWVRHLLCSPMGCLSAAALLLPLIPSLYLLQPTCSKTFEA